MSCPTPDPISLRDAVNMARFGDPVKAIEAFNRGAEAAGGADIPITPGDAVYETTLEDGRVVRVLFVDRPPDA